MGGFGTRFIEPQDGVLVGDAVGEAARPLDIDFEMNARSLGCHTIRCHTYDDYVAALEAAKTTDRTTVIVIENDRMVSVPGYESWWDVPVPEVSEMHTVQAAREEYEEHRAQERYFFE
jgi:3D-(3,5/4)-trihydroxycyclohexane-1,2-dione acylhydrolase (decyclizing)